jgi:DNA repair exonuclease SbcCD nuclease subunit
VTTPEEPAEDDIVVKLLHTADWHLGKQFPRFSTEHAKKLKRARLEVLDRILLTAERHSVDAVLCAGDLFDEPCPAAEWWEQAAAALQKRKWTNRPVFLLPGNHDPLIPESVWAKDHAFRKLLPSWVHVVDREDFTYSLPNDAILYAVPCTSKSGQDDPTASIPKREPGDQRVRIGMVHGSTFDAKDWQAHFPIAADAALVRGLDYLALGDTHGFRLVPPERHQPPTVYPGAPEPTAYDEKDPGNVAIVVLTQKRHASVHPERVARWSWEECRASTLAELRELASRTDLADRVLRLHVDMRVPAHEYDEAERLLEELEGTEARHGRVGVLELERTGLELETSNLDEQMPDLPDVLRSTARRLKAAAEVPDQRLAAERALYHLYRLTRKRAS